MYIVTAIMDTYDANGVEIAGIFDTEEKAIKAKARVEKWMEEEECEDYEVFIGTLEINKLDWYEIKENI